MKLDRKQVINVLLQFCVFRADQKSRWPLWPLRGQDIFNFSSETSELNSTKPNRKQELIIPALLINEFSRVYHVMLLYLFLFFNCFRAHSSGPNLQSSSLKSDQELVECLVCSDNLASVKVEPCGHYAACTECCVKMKRCIICRTVIENKIFPGMVVYQAV